MRGWISQLFLSASTALASPVNLESVIHRVPNAFSILEEIKNKIRLEVNYGIVFMIKLSIIVFILHAMLSYDYMLSSLYHTPASLQILSNDTCQISLKFFILFAGATTKVYKPVAFSATSPHNSKQAATDSKRISSEIQHSVSMSASEGKCRRLVSPLV